MNENIKVIQLFKNNQKICFYAYDAQQINNVEAADLIRLAFQNNSCFEELDDELSNHGIYDIPVEDLLL